ncbi:MAG: hypothetical protein OJF59_003227 [Cytophagales bacterium]|nr:MAG: hypothetical protein OJF59_003227 [Cytophagales bacterium]
MFTKELMQSNNSFLWKQLGKKKSSTTYSHFFLLTFLG